MTPLSVAAWAASDNPIYSGEHQMKKAVLGIVTLAACGFAASAFAGEDFPVAALPEPGMLGLLAAGIAVVVAVRLRGRK